MANILNEIYEGWKNYIFETPEMEILAKKRIEVCVDCDHYQKKMGICLMCGCPMIAKSRSPKSDCPIDKWDSL